MLVRMTVRERHKLLPGSTLNRYVLRAFHALWWRSVPFWRSTNDVLTARRALDIPNAAPRGPR